MTPPSVGTTAETRPAAEGQTGRPVPSLTACAEGPGWPRGDHSAGSSQSALQR